MTGSRRLPRAVLLDRDGTLIVDVPYNADPTRVIPMPTARQALAALRSRGIRVGVVTNQAGVARGLVDRRGLDAVNARVDELLGPFAVWRTCPHDDSDGCACRKPRPGMILDAASELGVPASEIAVVGDIGSDMEAAAAAGSRGVLVPTARTLAEEVDAAEEVAADLSLAVARLLCTSRSSCTSGGPRAEARR